MISLTARLPSLSVGQIALFIVGMVGICGLNACSDIAHAAGTIRGSSYKLGGLTAGLVGQTQGVRIRYKGLKKGLGFRIVVSNSEGEVVDTRSMGLVLENPPVRVDHIAVVTVEKLDCGNGDRQRLSIRFAPLDDGQGMISSTFIDEYIPEESRGAASSWPQAPAEVGEDEGLPVFYLVYGEFDRTLRVEFFVQ